MHSKFKVILLSFYLHFLPILGYKPVVLIHGIMTGAPSMDLIKEEIERVNIFFSKLGETNLILPRREQNHPDTIVYNTDRFSGWSSLENAWHQVDELGSDLMEICDRHPDGVHLIGYSQGGLLARAILEVFNNHTVHNFISLSSPQAGQFGSKYNIVGNFLNLN